ncbi:MAG: septum formation initiator family protein [Deltaproteobacteria bacterium]|nr:septum formation initiator family protein [bacterium]MCB9477214.1 septum formation initiator family protein [Deltaproteobacteria bacterium]MCB9479040.1 septum formation initiator family protein [Deltaproteobacteria bacterium]MCB9488102.1 septum formation initiator family protein [Deltaproteobacteria bacterium]
MTSWIKERSATLAVLGTLMVIGAYIVFSDSGLYKVWELHQQKVHLEQEVHDLHAETDRMQHRVESLRTDPHTIEMEIRKKLNMVQADETVFVFDGPSAAADDEAKP